MDPAMAANGEYGAGTVILALAFTVLMVVAWWKIFTKAGEPGWASIIPIYNVFVLLRVAGKPAWWILLLLIPLGNIVHRAEAIYLTTTTEVLLDTGQLGLSCYDHA